MKHWGKDTGWWAMYGARDITRRDLGGGAIRARMVLSDQAGVVLNVTALRFGSLIVGFYPDHRKYQCKTGYGIVYPVDKPPMIEHRCWARRLNLDLGPDPTELRSRAA